MKSEKNTFVDGGAFQRWYQDACGTAHGLELVGERWALLVVRELLLGPRRFNDLKAGLPGISANTLQQRLEGLERHGIIVQRRVPGLNVKVYELTEWGLEAEPVVMSLGRWAVRSPAHDPGLPLSKASLILSMRTMFDPSAADAVKTRIGVRIGSDAFLARVKKGRFTIVRTDASAGLAEAEATIAGEPAGIAAAIYSGQPLAAFEAAGTVVVEGDRGALQRFLSLFPLPAKAAPAAPAA